MQIRGTAVPLRASLLRADRQIRNGVSICAAPCAIFKEFPYTFGTSTMSENRTLTVIPNTLVSFDS